MRPKCGVPRWKSASRRGTRTSIGPKILLAAILLVAGVIGIGGIYPQVSDAVWVRDAVGTHPSPRRRATNTGQASFSAPNSAPVPEPSQSVAALEPPDAMDKPDAQAGRQGEGRDSKEKGCAGRAPPTGFFLLRSVRRQLGRLAW
jgi:hypothetical protein